MNRQTDLLTDKQLNRQTETVLSSNSNKAGYTANTSRGQVGRGGNAGFSTFRLVLTNGPTDRRMDGRTDKASYRVARPRLKKEKLHTVELRFNGPASNGIPPKTDANSWSLQLIFSYFLYFE